MWVQWQHYRQRLVACFWGLVAGGVILWQKARNLSLSTTRFSLSLAGVGGREAGSQRKETVGSKHAGLMVQRAGGSQPGPLLWQALAFPGTSLAL